MSPGMTCIASQGMLSEPTCPPLVALVALARLSYTDSLHGVPRLWPRRKKALVTRTRSTYLHSCGCSVVFLLASQNACV